MVKCILCSKPDSDDSKDGIPIHKVCWYHWLEVTHEGNVEKAVQSLHELYKQMGLIRSRSMNRHKDFPL